MKYVFLHIPLFVSVPFGWFKADIRKTTVTLLMGVILKEQKQVIVAYFSKIEII